jgi:hypothetical protein
MAWHPRQLADQTGRTFVVTGANSGIGLEAARGLVGCGAHVVLAVRDPAAGEWAAARLVGPGSTSVVELDLSDLDQVWGCATTLLDRHDNLSALIFNAGVMGGPRLLSAQGFERQMATNHLGHVALIAGLWPLLQASAARVVVVSSTEARGGHLSPQTTREQLLNPTPYDGRQVYRNTKQATCCPRRNCIAAAAGPVRRSVSSRCTQAPARPICSPVSWSLPVAAGWPASARSSPRCCSSRPPQARCPRSGRSTTGRLAAGSSAPPGSASSAAGRSCSMSTHPGRTRRRQRRWTLTEQALGRPLPV